MGNMPQAKSGSQTTEARPAIGTIPKPLLSTAEIRLLLGYGPKEKSIFSPQDKP